MHSCSGHGREVEGLCPRSISREWCVWSCWRAHGVSMLGAENTGSSASRTLLVGRRRLGDFALQRSLLLSSQDVPNVVWRSSSSACIGWSDIVGATVRIHRPVAILCEVVGPGIRVHRRIPVHPWAGSSLVVLQSIVRMSILPAGSERRRPAGVKLHFSETS